MVRLERCLATAAADPCFGGRAIDAGVAQAPRHAPSVIHHCLQLPAMASSLLWTQSFTIARRRGSALLTVAALRSFALTLILSHPSIRTQHREAVCLQPTQACRPNTLHQPGQQQNPRLPATHLSSRRSAAPHLTPIRLCFALSLPPAPQPDALLTCRAFFAPLLGSTKLIRLFCR